MSVARYDKVLIGTDETTGVTIASAASTTSSVVDASDASSGGDNTSALRATLFLNFTSTVTTGTVDVTVMLQRTGSTTYDPEFVSYSVSPKNGTKRIPIPLGDIPRYVQAKVTNNGTGANATNVTAILQVEKVA